MAVDVPKQPAADAIDVSVFDLKAVSPNATLKIDTRTSGEIIQSIADHGEAVAKALDALKTLLSKQTTSCGISALEDSPEVLVILPASGRGTSTSS